MRKLLILTLIFVLMSCAKNDQEQIDDAIDQALSLLSSEKCDEAISILEDAGRQNDNAIYLQVLASAYACKAGVDTISFLSNDLPDLDTTSISTLMKTASVITLSPETSTDSTAYASLTTALNILQDFDGGAQPSQLNRAAVYGTRKAGDMGMQIIVLSIIQMGKFLNWYGNVSGTGVKGGGTNTNSCFLNYTYAPAQAVIGAATGACTVTNDGHSGLDPAVSTAIARRHMCEGLMLFTNLLDVLENITVTGSTDLEDLADVADTASAQRDAIITAVPALATLLNETSNSDCVAAIAAAESNNMELIYASLFETGLQ